MLYHIRTCKARLLPDLTPSHSSDDDKTLQPRYFHSDEVSERDAKSNYTFFRITKPIQKLQVKYS
jgi:hypothetical protein